MINPANPVGAFLQGRGMAQQQQAQQQQMELQRNADARAGRQEQRAIEASELERQQWLAENLPQALAYSDTPEKWTQSVDYLVSLGFDEAGQYRDRFDMRDALLAQVTGQQRTQQQPASVMEYEFFSRLSPEQQRVFMDLQRSGNLLEIGGVPHYRNASGQVVPLSTLAGEMQGQGAIAGAVEGDKVRARSEAEREAQAPQRMERARQQIAAIDNTFAAIDRAMQDVGWNTAGPVGALLQNIPGTEARDLQQTVQTIKANIGFDRLQAMRDASPTGGALGQVAIQELAALQASIASLDQAQTPGQLRENLAAVRRHYENWRNVVTQTGEEAAQSVSNAETPEAPRVRRYNPATGRIE